MTHLATALLVCGHSTRSQLILAALDRLGFETMRAATIDEAQPLSPSADILLLCDDLGSEPLFVLAEAVRGDPQCADLPICLLVENTSADITHQAFLSSIDDVVPSPLSDIKLLARLRPLVRLATMRKELRLRTAIARKFGLDLPPVAAQTVSSTGQRLLIVGEDGRSLASILPSASLIFSNDPFQAETLLNGPAFDAAIMVPSADPTPFLDLCVHLRQNPKLFHLPVLIIDAKGVLDEDEAYRCGASGFLRPTASMNKNELISAIAFLVRRQRLRWKIRAGLAASLSPRTQDEDTGAYKKDFLDHYLPQRIAQANERDRQLSAILLRIPDIENMRRRFGDKPAAHLNRQLAQWINLMLRVEDLTALAGKNEFIAVLTDTSLSEATNVMHRIVGVLTYTDFAVADIYQPVRVWVRESCAQLIRGESPDAFMARLRQDSLFLSDGTAM